MSASPPADPPGAARPRFRPPAGACDCHAHVFGPRALFPLRPKPDYDPPDAPLEAYLALLDRLDLARGVAVQASVYGTDNAALEDALLRADGRLRGIAVVDAETIDTPTLARLDRAGVRGVRVTSGRMPEVGIGALEPLARRIAPYGWHLQLLADPPHLLALAGGLPGLPVPVVVDHIARVWLAGPSAAATVIDALRRLLASGRIWVKVSNAHKVAAGPPWDAALAPVRSVVAANPERVVWGTDWPHPSEAPRVPDDAALLDLLARAVPDEGLCARVLVDNPRELYGFGPDDEPAAREA